MIPYIAPPALALGPLTIHAFGILVGTAVLVGIIVGARRMRRLGLDTELGEGFVWWTIAGGFLGAHLFAVIFYFPEKAADDPLVLLRIWEDISSFGAMLGGAAGMWLFFRMRAPTLASAVKWTYVDVAAYVFPISLMVGRIGCALAHDHPGGVSDSPFAVSLATPEAMSFIRGVYAAAGRLPALPEPGALSRMGFHDLGWYEFLYLAVVVVPAVIALGRTRRRPGLLVTAFILLYMPGRFLLDFLRVTDARYSGLTPAQWAAIVAVLGALAVELRRRRPPSRDDPARPPAVSPSLR